MVALSLAANSTPLLVPSNSLTNSNASLCVPCLYAINLRTRVRKSVGFVSWSLVSDKDIQFLSSFLKAKWGAGRNSSSWCWTFVRCKKGKDWDTEGNIDLETEILDFMNNSEKPGAFPSKRDLMNAGRLDLVEAIVKQGGWLAMGWDSESDKEEEAEEEKHYAQTFDTNDPHLKVNEKPDDGVFVEENGAWSSELSQLTVSSSPVSTNSSVGPAEATAGSDNGIEGILNRLERERNLYLGLSAKEKGRSDGLLSNGSHNRCLTSPGTMDATVGDVQRIRESPNHSEIIVNEHETEYLGKRTLIGMNGSINTIESESWRSWSMKRAGFTDDFEAAEISSADMGSRNKTHQTGNNIVENKEGSGNSSNKIVKHEEINQTHIRRRLQYLQSELSSVLQSLRSNTEGICENDHGKGDMNSYDDLDKLSDTWEFQENEILKAQGKLRSMRTKLAVLEGKMALAMIDARRIVAEKQKRIDHARRASHLLRTVCIVWPKSASEVLLAGSFDGWATKRRMEKSTTGVFSLWLKLYPGKYEIKFIVDGQWKVDPLRPIVNSSGYENNLLIIT